MRGFSRSLQGKKRKKKRIMLVLFQQYYLPLLIFTSQDLKHKEHLTRLNRNTKFKICRSH